MKKYTLLTIVSLVFLISSLGGLIIIVTTVFHAFENPDLTVTQNILWVLSSKLKTVDIVAWIISYAIICFTSNTY